MNRFRYLIAFAIGFVGLLIVAGAFKMTLELIDFAARYMSRTALAVGCALATGIVGMALLRWFSQQTKL